MRQNISECNSTELQEPNSNSSQIKITCQLITLRNRYLQKIKHRGHVLFRDITFLHGPWLPCRPNSITICTDNTNTDAFWQNDTIELTQEALTALLIGARKEKMLIAFIRTLAHRWMFKCNLHKRVRVHGVGVLKQSSPAQSPTDGCASAAVYHRFRPPLRSYRLITTHVTIVFWRYDQHGIY